MPRANARRIFMALLATMAMMLPAPAVPLEPAPSLQPKPATQASAMDSKAGGFPDVGQGFAAGDRSSQQEREAAYLQSLTLADAKSVLKAVSHGAPWDARDQTHAASHWLLAAFEDMGLDAGLWPGTSPAKTTGDTTATAGVNVLARLVGSDWPDQVVLLSARGLPGDRKAGGSRKRDESAIAGLLHVAGGLAALSRSGWQPRRTIILAAWDPADGGRIGAGAWLDKGPMKAARSTVAVIAADRSLAGSTWHIATTPDLRSTVGRLLPASALLSSPDGRRGTGMFLAQGVGTIELERQPVGRRPGPEATAAAVHDSAQLWGTLALRLAESAIVPQNVAVVAQQALTLMRGVETAAARGFADNPPPLKDLRLSFLRLRQTAERWNAEAQALLDSAGSVPRGNDPSAARRRLDDAARSRRLVLDRLTQGSGRGDDCRNLLFCPAAGGDEPALFLPGLHQAAAAGNRESFIAQVLTLADTVTTATQALETSLQQLSRTQTEQP